MELLWKALVVGSSRKSQQILLARLYGVPRTSVSFIALSSARFPRLKGGGELSAKGSIDLVMHGEGRYMRTAKKPRNRLPPTTNNYRPEDLKGMRQALICACHDNPDVSATEAQRYDLADALVSVYQKHLSQGS